MVVSYLIGTKFWENVFDSLVYILNGGDRILTVGLSETVNRSQTNFWFKRFFAEGNPTVSKVFCDGSLFSPFLFGKYFDPSDAFPLWEFDSDVLLANLRSSGKTSVDWFQTDDAYVLKAELPGAGKTTLRIYIEKGKIVEISGQWKPHRREPQAKDWRSGHWWEQGHVRRLEFPEDAQWRKIEAFVSNDSFLELKIPRNTLECDASQRNNAARGTSVSVQV